MKAQTTLKDKHCMGCKYYRNMYMGAYYCAYIFLTEKSRPCLPGKDCTAKEKRSKKDGK